MAPAVGCSAASTSLAVVVFPQPDSPTRPSVSPRSMAKLTPSTALTQPRTPLSSEPPTGKCFLRSRTSSSGSPTRRLRRGQPAARGAATVQPYVRRLLDPAALHRARAARMEAAAERQARQVGGLAGDDVEWRAHAELGNGVEQGARVGMLRIVEEPADRLQLDDLARVHHRDPVAHL